jgi:hypothetical protein
VLVEALRAGQSGVRPENILAHGERVVREDRQRTELREIMHGKKGTFKKNLQALAAEIETAKADNLDSLDAKLKLALRSLDEDMRNAKVVPEEYMDEDGWISKEEYHYLQDEGWFTEAAFLRCAVIILRQKTEQVNDGPHVKWMLMLKQLGKIADAREDADGNDKVRIELSKKLKEAEEDIKKADAAAASLDDRAARARAHALAFERAIATINEVCSTFEQAAAMAAAGMEKARVAYGGGGGGYGGGGGGGAVMWGNFAPPIERGERKNWGVGNPGYLRGPYNKK